MSRPLTRRDALRAAAALGGTVAGCAERPADGSPDGVTPAPVPTDSPTVSPTRTPPPTPRTTPTGERFVREAACAGSTPVPSRASAGWPMADHDAGAGRYNAAAILPADRPDRAWVADLTGEEVSLTAPTVGPLVYVGRMAFGGREPSTTVHALDGRTGTERWSAALGYEDVTPPAYDAAGGRVYVLSGQDQGRTGPGHGEVLALDPTSGDVDWRFTVDRQLAAGPVVADGVVLATNATFDATALHALDADTGEERWRFEAGPDLHRAPTVSDGTVYVSRGGDELCALDLQEGTERWCRPLDADLTRPVVGHGRVQVGYRRGLAATCAATGEPAWWWLASGPSTAEADLRGVRSEPVVGADRLYVETHDTSPFEVGAPTWLYALDPAAGAWTWRTDLGRGGGTVGARNGVVTERATADGRGLVALGRDGDVRWTLPGVGAPLALGAEVLVAAAGARVGAYRLA